MLAPLLLSVALLSSSSLQDGGSRPPDPERVKSAVRELKEAFAKGDPAARISAIEDGTELLDPAVIAAIEKGMHDGDENVRGAAVGALRYMRHPDALKALHEELERNKKLPYGSDHAIGVIKAIGEHGSSESIAVLSKDLYASADRRIISARIYALGNIRTVKSVDALFDSMKLAGPNKMQPYMDEFRLALIVLTGADQGRSQELWMRWWNDHKKEITVLPEPPKLAKADARRWYDFWDRYPMQERREKRGERGKDPDRGGK